MLQGTAAGKTVNAARTPATKRLVCVVVGGVGSDAASTMSAAMVNVPQESACKVVVAARTAANPM